MTTTDQHRPIQLQPTDVERYRRDGYLLPSGDVLPPPTFGWLTETFEGLLERYGPDGLDTIHFRHPELLDVLLSDSVLDLVEPLVGPDIGLWSSHFICKEPGTGKATPWHEDGAYWDGRISTMQGIVTVWLALDPVDAGNGAMQVLPGTHHGSEGRSYEQVDPARNIFDRELSPEHVDEGAAVTFELAPNQCSLHDARIIHGAPANTSGRRRAGYTMRYFPTTSRIVPERNEGHRVWLARGVDRAGNHYEDA